MKILYILTAPQMAGFLRGNLASLKRSGFEPLLCVPEKTEAVQRLALQEGVPLFAVPMKREISLFSDFISYLKIFNLISQIQPDITVTIGPKAGLLGGLAAATFGVPCRIQTKWGIRLETTRGLLRQVLILADKVAAASAHAVLCDSQSGKDRTIELRLAPADKVKVVGYGSANGIDINKFEVNSLTLTQAQKFREELGVNSQTPIVGFVGRITKDKGIAELYEAWLIIKSQRSDAILVMIGPEECESDSDRKILEKLKSTLGVHFLGHRSGLEGIFLAMNVLLLPSHREGFGVVVLEAASVQVPTVGFAVTGMKDSVVNGETGALVELGDVEGLAQKTLSYLNKPELRKMHGETGRQRVHAYFNQQLVWKAYFETFKKIAQSQGLNTSHLKWD